MAGRRREENLESKIIIRNYPSDTTERDMRIMFEKYGKIDDCKMHLSQFKVDKYDLFVYLSGYSVCS